MDQKGIIHPGPFPAVFSPYDPDEGATLTGISGKRFSRVLWFLALGAMSATTIHAGKVYWTSGSTPSQAEIRRANLNGTDVETVIAGGPGVPRFMTIDVVHGKMYWADISVDVIRRANLDGTNQEVLVADLGNPRAVALDLGEGKVYWTDVLTDKIQRADLDGSDVEDVLATPNPDGIALDTNAHKMYWTETSNNNEKIRRANLDGSDVENLVTDGLKLPLGIALDLDNGKMYWTDWDAGKVQRANLDGSNVEDVIDDPHLDRPNGIALDLAGGKMYVVDSDVTDGIVRADLDGSNLETIVKSVSGHGIALAIFGVCGDGVLDTFEECDDGNNVSGDGCQSECLLSECGDGVVDAGEECDDGNPVSCDGCSSDCGVEIGFDCGDGIVNTGCGEECDDGNNVNADGCQGDCDVPLCGDLILDPEEECDDGDDIDFDECTNDCTFPDVNILYDQTDFASVGGASDQDFESEYVLYDTEAGDDFTVTFPAGWDIESVVTPGIATLPGTSEHVNIRFYADGGDQPGEPLCEFPAVTSFIEAEGDLVITLPQTCALGLGTYWMSQQVRREYSPFGQHFWSDRLVQTGAQAVWRNPGDGFGTGCVNWTPRTLCLETPHPDFLFQLRGPEKADPEPVPAGGPLGALMTVLSLAGVASYWLARHRR